MKRLTFIFFVICSLSAFSQSSILAPMFDSVRFKSNRGKIYELITYGGDSIKLNGNTYRFSLFPNTNYWQYNSGSIYPKPRNYHLKYPAISILNGSSAPVVSSPVWWRQYDSSLVAYAFNAPDFVGDGDYITGCNQVYVYEPPSVSDAIIYVDDLENLCGCFTVKNNGNGSELTIRQKRGLLIDGVSEKILKYGESVTICPNTDELITTHNSSDYAVNLWQNQGTYIYNNNSGDIFTRDSMYFGSPLRGGYMYGDSVKSTWWLGLKDWYLLRIKDAPITQRRIIPRLTQTFKTPYTTEDLEEWPQMEEDGGGVRSPNTVTYHPVWFTTYAAIDTLDYGQTIWGHWIAAASPKGNFGTAGTWGHIYNTVGMEIDLLNRFRDEGYREEPLVVGDTAGKWTRSTFGLQLIPENKLNMVGTGGTYEPGYHATAAIMIGHSPDRVGGARAAKWHVPIYINSDATTTTGTSIVLGGGSEEGLSPNIGIKFLNYHNIGIDFSHATFKSSVLKTAYSQTFTDGVVTKTLSQLAHDSLLNMKNRIIVSLDSAVRLHGNSTVFKTLCFPFISNYGYLFATANYDSMYVDFEENAPPDSSLVYSFVVNMPTDWKEGSTVYPKVRYKYTTNDGVPNFCVQYRWMNIGGGVNTEWSWLGLTSNTATVNQTIQVNYNSSGIIGTYKTINSILLCKVYLRSKLGGSSDTISAFDFQIVYESDAMGANSQTSKN